MLREGGGVSRLTIHTLLQSAKSQLNSSLSLMSPQDKRKARPLAFIEEQTLHYRRDF